MNNIFKLQTAEALEALEFYVTQGMNTGPELNCRIWKMPCLSKQEMDQLSNELNRCISHVCTDTAKKLKLEVKDSL